MKKLVKILPILLLVIMLLSTVSVVFADPTDPSTLKGTQTTQFDTMGKKIIGMVQAIGSIASVLVLVVLGIKYMMGSAEEKAEYKKTMIPYVVGAVLVFAAANIAGVVAKFAGELMG